MTSPTTSLLPPMVGAFLPPASPTSGLQDGEQQLIGMLSTKLAYLTPWMLTSQSYYDGTQRLADLGVSIPPQLSGVRTIVDWPRICVDPLVQRAVVDGFRMPGETDVDTELEQHWQANNLDAEFPLCALDSLALGRGYMIIGSPDTPGDSPIVTVESPFNVAIDWDPRTRRVTAGYQAYQAEGVYRGVLYLPNVTVSMSRTQSQMWTVDDRDEHNFGEVPVVRFANRARSADREGRSEITPAVRATTDSTCRTLLAMEIAREFYAVPHRYILGAQESDFQDGSGNPKSAIDMVMSKFLAFERDETGEVPQVGQFTAFNPAVFTEMIDENAKLMASYTGFPADYFGVTSTANPASADAIRSAQDGMNRRGRQVQNQFSDPLECVMGLVWRFANNGDALPQDMAKLETDWKAVETPTPSATSAALAAQKEAGFVTANSDVARKYLGYSAVERQLLAAEWEKDKANAEIADVAANLEDPQIRVAEALAKDQAMPPGPPAIAPVPVPKP